MINFVSEISISLPSSTQNSRICRLTPGIIPDLNLPYDPEETSYSESKDQTTALKFDPKGESLQPEPLLGASPSEIRISVPSSTQASAERSINATSLSTDSLSGNKINNSSENSRIRRLTPGMVPDLNLPYDHPINMKINSVSEISSQVSQASKFEETSYSEANFWHSQDVFNNPGVARSSSPDPDESHSIKRQENNESTLQENVRRQSTRVRPLTTRALEAFASGSFSLKRRRKGSEKTLNPDRFKMT